MSIVRPASGAAVTVALAAALLAVAVPATAGDLPAGRVLFNTCLGCHGVPGYTNVYPSYHVPKLGGQHADYLAAALKEYRSGQRAHPTMTANASGLDEAQSAEVAAWLSKLPPSPGQPAAKGDAAAGKDKVSKLGCVACHGADGNSAAGTFPKLAGQHADYLVKALEDYHSGARKNPMMAPMAQNLTAQDRLDLAAWFSSQPQGLSVVK
ncbi:MAG TPA: c-type cytochrome [Plasticicumulans sp.]|nr:c-type cytochrome [Plasticicumulans sp.]HNI21963.1 c-type cytochrome [Plasticicumulans sp.]